jgi:RecQ family ATP-dependent DNA helicase
MEIEYNKILKKHFGYEKLKDKQFEIINNILNNNKDVLGILPTGFGKSMCYMLPYLITHKNIIIISPLIALIKDQHSDLLKRGIPVCSFNSSNDNKKKDRIDILNGNPKIIYMTPEYFINSENFIKMLVKNDTLAFIAIDEAHCVSSWGNEFRPAYTNLSIIKTWIPEIPILALTATASIKVREDICNIIGLIDPIIIYSSFDRPNLKIIVKSKNTIQTDLINLLQNHKNDYSIVYCKTRNETDKIAQILNKYNIEAHPYHAGLLDDDRQDIQTAFINGEFKCIVATIAFGLGINIPNVRIVIHYGCPKNLESYYQEIGRAGRDGLTSYCYLYYSSKDFMLNRFFLKEITDEKYKKHQENQVASMEKFTYYTGCRRKVLLRHFNEVFDKDNCGGCDNCLNNNKNDNSREYTLEGYKILSLINSMKWNFGSATIIDTLVGSASKKLKNYSLTNSVFYGSGKNKKKESWKEIIRDLINNNYLKTNIINDSFGATTLHITTKGLNWLHNVVNPNGSLKNNLDESNRLFLGIIDNSSFEEINSDDENVKETQIIIKSENNDKTSKNPIKENVPKKISNNDFILEESDDESKDETPPKPIVTKPIKKIIVKNNKKTLNDDFILDVN